MQGEATLGVTVQLPGHVTTQLPIPPLSARSLDKIPMQSYGIGEEVPLPINVGMNTLPLGRPCPTGVHMLRWEGPVQPVCKCEESWQNSPPEHLYSVEVEEASTERASRRTVADRKEVAKANEVMMKKNKLRILRNLRRGPLGFAGGK